MCASPLSLAKTRAAADSRPAHDEVEEGHDPEQAVAQMLAMQPARRYGRPAAAPCGGEVAEATEHARLGVLRMAQVLSRITSALAGSSVRW